MKRTAVVMLLLLVGASARAQPAPGDDPIAQHLFPPELVMRHGTEIGLDEKQRASMKEVVQKAQGRFLDLQWDMQSEAEKMVRLLEARPIDESAALAQVEKVLSLEREVKKAQLSLLIRIKNLLTDSQQAKLSELRKKPG